MPARNSSSSTGFKKKADAPPAIALERTDESSLLVRIITRVDGEMVRSRPLDFKSVHDRHQDIDHHHLRLASFGIAQKRVRIQKGFYFPSRGGKKPPGRREHGRIVVDQANSENLCIRCRNQDRSPYFVKKSPFRRKGCLMFGRIAA